jgi:hypothetical protein
MELLTVAIFFPSPSTTPFCLYYLISSVKASEGNTNFIRSRMETLLFSIEVVGSGSLEQDSSLSIVAMKKEEQTRFVHHRRFRKRQSHADKAS